MSAANVLNAIVTPHTGSLTRGYTIEFTRGEQTSTLLIRQPNHTWKVVRFGPDTEAAVLRKDGTWTWPYDPQTCLFTDPVEARMVWFEQEHPAENEEGNSD